MLKNKILAAAIASLIGSTSWAGVGHGEHHPPKTPTIKVDVKNNVKNNQSQSQQQNQSQEQSLNNENQNLNENNNTNESNSNSGASSNVNYNNVQRRIPVSTAYSASLTAGQDTCLGSASGGLQTSVLGVSGGSTKHDTNCEMIKQVHVLEEMNLWSAACFRARDGKDGEAIDRAMKNAGVDCATFTGPAEPKLEIHSSDVVTKEELNTVVKKLVTK